MLRSLFRKATDASHVSINVIYTASSSDHESQYQILIDEYSGRVQFARQVDFRGQVLDLLRGDGLAPGEPERSLLKSAVPAASAGVAGPLSEKHVFFMVDDTLFFREFQLAAVQSALDAHSDAMGFSLRLGRNTDYCYVLNRPQALPRFQALADGVLKYRWNGSDGDFAYPLELSSSVYRVELVRQILETADFENPNTMESELSKQARRYGSRHPSLLCFDRSVAFSVPANRVQTVFPNRASDRPGSSIEDLAHTFGRGLRIDVAALDEFVPRGCHEEVEYRFEEPPR